MKLPFLKISTAYQPNHVQQMGTFLDERAISLLKVAAGMLDEMEANSLFAARRSFMFWRGSQGFRCSELVSQARRL